MYELTAALLLNLCSLYFIANAEQCKPKISEGSHSQLHIGGHTTLQCNIAACSEVSKVIFEKKGIYHPSLWTPVFEGFDNTKYHALDTGDRYTLDKRHDYSKFHLQHILYIYTLAIKDQGEWRCVVYGKSNEGVESLATRIKLEEQCRPEISQGSHSKPKIAGYTTFECDTATCSSVSKIIYEKTFFHQPTKWTPVYKGFTKTHHRALNRTTGIYSLANRTDYAAFQTRHVLYIDPLVLQDQGKWRCVVYDDNKREAKSQPMDFYLTHLCTPNITEGSHSKKELGGHLYLKCDISSCDNIFKVIFEKTDAHQITQSWTPVFEGIDATHKTALDNADGYTLEQRNEYSVFPTYHLLYIRPFTIKDTGRWRCVLHHKDRRSESKAIDIFKASLCTPVITEESHSRRELGGYLYLMCDISACDSVSRVVFEKTGVKQFSQWTPVFEEIDDTHYAALKTGEDYTLKERHNYFASPNYHLLYIKHLTMEDFGEWRCVLHHTNRRAESKAIPIFSVDGPHLTIKSENPNAVAKVSETFTCEINGIDTEPVFEWTVTSLSTSEKYYGNTTVSKQRDDGLWYANNVVKLRFNNPGKQTLNCSVTTKNGDQLMHTHVTVDIKDTIWKNIFTLCVSLLLIVIVIMIVGLALVKQGIQMFGDSYYRGKQGPFLRSAPLLTEWTDTIPMAANTCSIWRANESDFVCLGKQNRASITVIDNNGIKTNYYFLTGTGILHGLFLSNNIHMLNVYDQLSKTYSIHCVCINLRSLKKQVIPQYTLNLNYGSPGCIFRVDKSNVGVYSYLNRVVEVFNMNDGSSNDSISKDETESKLLTGLPVELIKLTGYTAHECDMLDTNRNGQICVSSYRYSDVYIYARSGEFIATITGSKLYDPVHIQCFSDFSLAVVDRVGKIHHFDKKLSKFVIALGENMIVKAAVFTKTKLWIIDGKDSTKIHTYKFN